MSEKVENYSEELTARIVEAYASGTTDEERVSIIDALVEETGKTKRSIIAKLSKEGIYVAVTRKSKVTGDRPETKPEIVARIEKGFNFAPGTLHGLDKAPKMVLLKLLSFTEQALKARNAA